MVLVCKLSQTIDKPINYVSCALRASITVGEESARSQVAVREMKREKRSGIGEIPSGGERNKEREEIGHLATRRLRAGGCAQRALSLAGQHWPLATAARCHNK